MNLTDSIKKWVDIEFGLFGPALSYHTSGLKEDNARFVLSLLLFTLYFTLPFRHKTESTNKYSIYGVYSDTEPDRLVFQWGKRAWKWIMPWAWVRTGRVLLDNNDQPMTEPLFDFIRQDCLYGHEFMYHVTKFTYKPYGLKFTNWFSKEMYEVNVTFKMDINGYTGVTFSIPENICVLEHIGVHISKILDKPF